MGCDIHAHVEVKINDKWEHYSTPDVHRSYEMFARMADVRNWEGSNITPISKPKGLPEDVTFLTKYDSDLWDCDAHSHSFLNADEIVLLESFLEEVSKERGDDVFWGNTFGWLFGNTLAGFKKYPEDIPKGVQDVRLIFWFDN